MLQGGDHRIDLGSAISDHQVFEELAWEECRHGNRRDDQVDEVPGNVSVTNLKLKLNFFVVSTKSLVDRFSGTLTCLLFSCKHSRDQFCWFSSPLQALVFFLCFVNKVVKWVAIAQSSEL
jgi:hypothetical protein